MNIETALATVRKWAATTDKNEDARDCVARWLAENADHLFVIPPLEWEERHDLFYSNSHTVFGRIEVWETDSGWHWRYLSDTHKTFLVRCESLADGKAKADAWYRQRVTSALRPAIGEVGT